MPHLTIQYTANLEAHTDMGRLCRQLSDGLANFRDEAGGKPFPIGGIRVLAYPAAHFSVADGAPDHGFVYLNLRLAPGRSPAVLKAAGELLASRVRAHFEPLLGSRALGVTLQIDEGAAVFDAKMGNLHALLGQ